MVISGRTNTWSFRIHKAATMLDVAKFEIDTARAKWKGRHRTKLAAVRA
jgi:hypothetical protein